MVNLISVFFLGTWRVYSDDLRQPTKHWCLKFVSFVSNKAHLEATFAPQPFWFVSQTKTPATKAANTFDSRRMEETIKNVTAE